jgi:carboxymethylenebutenolidase
MSSEADDIKSLMPHRKVTRRKPSGGAAAGIGFALAAQPVSAETIVTDTDGLDAADVKIDAGDTKIPGYYARPKGGSGEAVILVVQEIFGLHEHIKDVCRRFAHEGYFAIAPELYARQGDATQIEDIGQLIAEIVSKVPDAQVMSDLDATTRLAGEMGADGKKLGVTGFCWGGRATWLYSAHNPDLKAGVAWYGRLVGDETPNTPRHPVDLAGELNGPVLGLYGGADQGIPLNTVEQMKAAIAAAGGASEFNVYPDAPHAFYADYRPSYRPEAAEDGWARALAWFRKHGVA